MNIWSYKLNERYSFIINETAKALNKILQHNAMLLIHNIELVNIFLE